MGVCRLVKVLTEGQDGDWVPQEDIDDVFAGG